MASQRGGAKNLDSSCHSMRRLLYLAYAFPPAQFVASIRAWNTADQLARRGWQVTVVTPHPNLWRRVDVSSDPVKGEAREGLEMQYTNHYWPWLVADYLRNSHPRAAWAFGGLFRKLLRGLGFEMFIGWIPAVLSACAKYRPGDVDVILATGNPFVAFGLARRLAARLRCPYVLDYRDLWTYDVHSEKRHPPWIHWTERRDLDTAAAVTVVSKSLAELLERDFGVGDRLHVISNGYNASELATVQALSFPEPAVMYAGILCPPKRVLDPVFYALASLNRATMEWKFHYYGTMAPTVADAAERAGIANRLVLHGQVPRQEALAAAKGAHCTVVVSSVLDKASLGERGIVTGKVFELVGMGVPILLVAPPGSDAEVVVRNCGRRFSGSEISGMAAYLAEMLGGQRRSFPPPPEYEWGEVGSRLNEILENVFRDYCQARERII